MEKREMLQTVRQRYMELQAILTDDGVLMAMLHTGGEWHIDGITVKGDAGECIIHSI